METAKLTLRPAKAIIELAHQIADEDSTSITQMFSAFIIARSRQRKNKKNIPVGPLTRSVIGVLKVPQDWDYKADMENILDEKYGK